MNRHLKGILFIYFGMV